MLEGETNNDILNMMQLDAFITILITFSLCVLHFLYVYYFTGI